MSQALGVAGSLPSLCHLRCPLRPSSSRRLRPQLPPPNALQSLTAPGLAEHLLTQRPWRIRPPSPTPPMAFWASPPAPACSVLVQSLRCRTACSRSPGTSLRPTAASRLSAFSVPTLPVTGRSAVPFCTTRAAQKGTALRTVTAMAMATPRPGFVTRFPMRPGSSGCRLTAAFLPCTWSVQRPRGNRISTDS